VTQNAQNSSLSIIDFHVHIRPPWWRPVPLAGLNARDAAWHAAWSAKLTAPDDLLSESAEAGVGLNLLSSTIEGISGIRGPVDHDEVRRHNDYLGELAAAHPGRLAALAAVDAFSGEVGAREAERAVLEGGHVGLVIDSARDGVYAGDPSTRPVFEVADRLGVPILVHPVAAETAEALTRSAGRAGNSFGRGHVNGTAFLSILESGVLEDHPDLDLVFTGIGLGALVIAAAELPQYGAAARGRGDARPRIGCSSAATGRSGSRSRAPSFSPRSMPPASRKRIATRSLPEMPSGFWQDARPWSIRAPMRSAMADTGQQRGRLGCRCSDAGLASPVCISSSGGS
jgi:predicted TIM-barrel fold metal-dependent hydrolase